MPIRADAERWRGAEAGPRLASRADQQPAGRTKSAGPLRAQERRGDVVVAHRAQAAERWRRARTERDVGDDRALHGEARLQTRPRQLIGVDVESLAVSRACIDARAAEGQR